MRLLGPDQHGFCTDIFFALDYDPYVRLLVLPADPEAAPLELDQTLRASFNEVVDPVNGGKADWGQALPGYRAALRARTYSAQYSRYLALFRSGAVEMGLGEDAVYQNNGKRWFRLLTIVGRSWAALDAFRRLVVETGVDGPFQVTLALRDCKDASLGHVATGWNNHWDHATSREANVCHVVEIAKWGDLTAHETAFLLGRRLEQSFGSTDVRFLDREGPNTGSFGSSQYRW